MTNPSTQIGMEDNHYFIEKDYITPQRLAVHRIGQVYIKRKRVYVPQLSLILRTNNIPVHNRDTQKKELINGSMFHDSYVEGFDEGIAYFEKHFSVSPDILYGVGKQDYVRDLHGNFYHQHEQNSNFGWEYWIKSYPEVISNAEIKRYGFYAGIVSEVHKLLQRHPKVFKDFEICIDHGEKIRWHISEPVPKEGKKRISPEQVSFVLTKNAISSDAVNDVMKKLITGNLIAGETRLPDFRKIFTGVEIEKQIEWIGSLASLSYFANNVWKFHARGRSQWKTAVHCFSHQATPQFHTLKNNKKPSRADKLTIDNAMKHFNTTHLQK